MLVDRATGALQVDMELIQWGGVNTTQLFVQECEQSTGMPPCRKAGETACFPPPRNRFTFRAGGVTGPGSYGPFQAAAIPGLAEPLEPPAERLPLGWKPTGHRCGFDTGEPPTLPWLCWEHSQVFWGGFNPVGGCAAIVLPGLAALETSLESSCGFVVEQDRFIVNCTRGYMRHNATFLLDPKTPDQTTFWMNAECDYVEK
jgi:hypothetical protein